MQNRYFLHTKTGPPTSVAWHTHFKIIQGEAKLFLWTKTSPRSETWLSTWLKSRCTGNVKYPPPQKKNPTHLVCNIIIIRYVYQYHVINEDSFCAQLERKHYLSIIFSPYIILTRCNITQWRITHFQNQYQNRRKSQNGYPHSNTWPLTFLA